MSCTQKMNKSIQKKIDELFAQSLKLPNFCKPRIGNTYSTLRKHRIMYVFSGSVVGENEPAYKLINVPSEKFYDGEVDCQEASLDLSIDANVVEYNVSLSRMLSKIADGLDSDDVVIHRFFPRPFRAKDEEPTELDEQHAVKLFEGLLQICHPTTILFKNDKTMQRISDAFLRIKGSSVRNFLEECYIQYAVGNEALEPVANVEYYVEKLLSDNEFLETALNDDYLQECLYWDDVKIRYHDLPKTEDYRKSPKDVKRFLLNRENASANPDLYRKMLRPFMVPKFSRYLYSMPRAWEILCINKTEWEETCASFADSSESVFESIVSTLSKSSDTHGLAKIRVLSAQLTEAYAQSDMAAIGLLVEELAAEADRMNSSRRIAASQPLTLKQKRARTKNAAKARKSKLEKMHKARTEEEKIRSEEAEKRAKLMPKQTKVKQERSPKQLAALANARLHNPKVNPDLKR